ncbi:MAG TPA: response regulator [Verrucomicrobiae bacterium]|nr:response regulator [Verrucomicrobiae bacterium]
MVADDDETARESLGKALQGEGYQVVLAANGSKAVEMFCEKADSADLLLIDLNMHLKNGLVAVHQLLEVNSSLPIFIITGLSHQNKLAEKSGVRALVEKPIDLPELLQLIRKQFSDVASSVSRNRVAFSHLPADGFNLFHRSFLPAGPYGHWGLNE